MRRALVAGAVVGATLLLARRRFRGQLAAAVKLPAAIVLAVLATPADFLDDVGSFFGGIGGDIKNFVLAAVHAVRGWAQGIFDWLSKLVGQIFGILDGVWYALDNVVGTVWGVIEGIVRGLLHDLYNVLMFAVHGLEAFANAVLHVAYVIRDEAFALARSLVDDVIRWVSHNIFDPLYHLALFIWHNVFEPAIDFVHHLIDKALSAIDSVWRWASGMIGHLWDFAFGWAKRLLEVVEKAFDWLVMLAEHGPTWVVHEIESTFHHAPELLVQGFYRSVESHGDEVDRLLADLVG